MPIQDFPRYEKMPQSLKKLGLTANEFAELDKLKWVVTEKVHGANFSFIYEEGQLKFAKRKEFLAWKDDFFGFQLLVSKLEHRIITLLEELSIGIEAKQYIVYGELCGGNYPHLDVTPDENVEAIQTGVYYSPAVEFCAFDIAIVEDEVSSKYYLDYAAALLLFEKHDLLHAQPLFIGKLNEAFDFDTKINSTLPKILGLPVLDNNLIEGIVIKPLEHLESELTIRPIIKIKNPEFEEQKKFHEAEKWSYLPTVSSNAEDLHFLVEAAKNYVTKNRLQSAISKVGALDPENEERMAAIENEFLEDVMIDFNEDNDNIFEDIDEAQNKWIRERIRTAIKQLIR